jgi:hypothetical protein
MIGHREVMTYFIGHYSTVGHKAEFHRLFAFLTYTVAEWRKRIPQGASDDIVAREIPRVPAIFLIYK